MIIYLIVAGCILKFYLIFGVELGSNWLRVCQLPVAYRTFNLA